MDFFMEQKKLKGVYLHGYKGYVTEEKQVYLNQLGEVYHPNIDYDNHPTIIFELWERFKDQNIDFVAGTSLGGLLIYQLAKLLDVPVLLLNPAITAVEIVKDFIPKEVQKIDYKKNVMVVVGLKDDIILPQLQLDFFEEELKSNTNISIKKIDELGHFVPIQEFEEVFNEFVNIYITKNA